jgi:hypothetical protein
MAISYQDLVDILLIESGQFIADLDATLLDQNKMEIMIQRELALYSRYKPNYITTYAELYNQKVFSLDIDGYVPVTISDIRTDMFNNIGYSFSPLPAAVHNYYWRYDNPILYFRYPQGIYTYTYTLKHIYDQVNMNLPTINIEDRVINMILGRFLMTLGKSRRAFTVDEIPIQVDASEMISEGKEIYDNTLEEVRQNALYNLAIVL